jgi:hypothetical protein
MAVRHLALVALGAVARTDAAETAAREGPAHVIVPWEDKEHAPTLYGGTWADAHGLHFGDGAHYGGDFAAVHTPVDDEHLQSGTFTLAIWGRKTTCETGGIYEYMFSEALGRPGDTEDEHPGSSWGNANTDYLAPPWISAYIGCERHGSGYSSLGGTILRYLLEDDNHHEYMLDVPLAAEGGWDDIAGVWQHHVLSVQPASLHAYLDGVAPTVGFYQGHYQVNKAYPDPSSVVVPVGSFVGINTIVLGARHDLDPNRYFHGTIGLVALFDRALSAPEVLALSMAAGDEPSSLRPHVCCSAETLAHLAPNNTLNPMLWQGGFDQDGNGNVTWFMAAGGSSKLDDTSAAADRFVASLLVGMLVVATIGVRIRAQQRRARDERAAGKHGAHELDVVQATVVVDSPMVLTGAAIHDDGCDKSAAGKATGLAGPAASGGEGEASTV